MLSLTYSDLNGFIRWRQECGRLTSGGMGEPHDFAPDAEVGPPAPGFRRRSRTAHRCIGASQVAARTLSRSEPDASHRIVLPAVDRADIPEDHRAARAPATVLCDDR